MSVKNLRKEQIIAYKQMLLSRKILLILLIEILVFIFINHRLFSAVDEVTFSAQELFNANQNTGIVLENGVNRMETDGESIALRSPNFTLYPGSYDVKIQYNSNKDGRGNILESTGKVIFYNGDGSVGLQSDVTLLSDAKEVLETRIIVTAPVEMDDVFFVVLYDGVGVLDIGDVQIKEFLSYRIIKAIATILLFAFINFLIFLWSNNTKKSNKILARCVEICTITVIASLLLFVDYLFTGHDGHFHMERISTLAYEFGNGQFPVRITRDYAMNQYGYVNSLFYCDLFLYLPALLFRCGISLATSYKIYIVGINFLTTIIAYYSFRKITRNGTISMIGAGIYTLSFYRIISIYTRAALGEYTAMAFLPLIVAGMYLIYTQEKVKFQDWILLSLGMSGVILSHVLTTQMVVVFLVIFCVCCFRKTFHKMRIITLLKAVVITTLLTAWFVVPMLQSMGMEIAALHKGYTNIQAEGLYLAQIFSNPITLIKDGSATNSMVEMPLSIGQSLMIGLGVIVYCLFKSREWKIQKSNLVKGMGIMGALACLALIFTLHFFPWDTLDVLVGSELARILRAIQFPYRYLGFATILISCATVVALKLLYEYQREYCKVAVVLLIVFTLIFTSSYYGRYIANGATTSGVATTGNDIRLMNTEYRLTGITASIMETSDVIVSEDTLKVQSYQQIEGDTQISLYNSGDHKATLTIPIQNYDHYILRDISTGEKFEIYTGEHSCITTEIPANYGGTLVLTYEPPILWRMSEIISLLSLIGVGILGIYKVRQKVGVVE